MCAKIIKEGRCCIMLIYKRITYLIEKLVSSFNSLKMNKSHITPWIISRQADLRWFILPALVSIVVPALYVLLTQQVGWNGFMLSVVIYFVWSILLDNSHFVSTFTRTYFDKDFFNRHRVLLISSLLWIVGAPLVMTFGYMYYESAKPLALFYNFLATAATLYAFYHTVRQHWGFVVLYRKKNGEADDITRELEAWMLFTGSILPFAWKEHLTAQYGLSIITRYLGNTVFIEFTAWGCLAAGVIILFLKYRRIKPYSFYGLRFFVFLFGIGLFCFAITRLPGAQVLGILAFLLAATFLGCLCVYIYQLRLQYQQNRFSPNFPKWMLMLSVFTLYIFLNILPVPFLIMAATNGIAHNMQYLRLVQFYNENKYKPAEKKRYGLAVMLTQKIIVTIALMLVFDVFQLSLRVITIDFITDGLLYYLIRGFIMGWAFHHYFLDSIIWRLRKDKTLNNELHITPAVA
jgi:hypothetical protein